VISDLTRRAVVIATSAVTLVTALAVAISAFIAEITPQLPDGWQDNAFQLGATVTAIAGAAATAIRRLTTVPADQRGLLPPDRPDD
jgi:hypothetical protein